MYPKSGNYEGKSNKVLQLNDKASAPCSQAFNDNFDGINLTQMLENTAVDATLDEAPQKSVQSFPNSPLIHASEQCDPLLKNSLHEDACSNLSRGFKTASGGVLSAPSRQSLMRARELFKECMNQLDESGSNRVFHEDDPSCDKNGSPFHVLKQGDPIPKTGLCKDTSSDFGCDFKTAAGASLKAPSNESLSRAKRLLEECTNQAEDSSADHDDLFSFRKSCHGFKTASGTALEMPSCESLSRAKRIFEECVEQTKDLGACSDFDKTPKERTLWSHSKSYVSSLCRHDLIDYDRPLRTHPKTVKSGELLFENYMKYTVDGKHGHQRENDSCGKSLSFGDFATSDVSKSNFSINSLNLNDCQVAHSLHSKTANDSPSRVGFVTDLGKLLILTSDESMKRAKRLLEDCSKDYDGSKLTDNDAQSDVLTHRGGKSPYVGLSKDFSEKTNKSDECIVNKNEVEIDRANGGSSVTSDTSFLVSNHENTSGGFASAVGRLLTPISDVTPRQATTTFSKCALNLESELNLTNTELQSLRGDVSPMFVPATTGVDGEMSPTLDFDGSFEISSQMMNVIEGTSPQFSDNVESSEVERQRVEARMVQEAEADRYFKPPVKSHLNSSCRKPRTGGSLSIYSATHKIVHEPAMPGTLWRLRRCTGCSVNEDLLSIRTSYSPEKDLHFAGDFLRLDETSSLSVNSALNLKFKLDSNIVNISYRLGDNVEVIPDSFGYAGCAEVVRAFVCSPGVTGGLVSRRWITHHYSQIAWRFGCVALMHYRNLVDNVFPHLSLPDPTIQRTDGRLLLHTLLLELKYRYDRELEAVERPPVRKIIERDDTPAKRIVLCVSHLEKLPNHRYRGRLTDGWYHIDWVPDCMLTRVIERGRIKVGTKLVTAGAELIQTPSGFDGSLNSSGDSCDNRNKGEDAHLFDNTSNGLSLRLNGNSTRPASANARLGFVSHPPIAHLPPIPLSTISSEGGIVSCICVLIQRRFQLQYMETCSLHVDSNEGERTRRHHVFRDPRSEQAAERLHAEKCHLAFDQAVNEFNSSRGSRGRRVQPQTSFLASLGLDGEALWNAVKNALDPDLAESDLSAAQLDAMFRYKEAVVQEIFAQSSSKREVTQLLRLQVAGIHPLDIEKQTELPLTLWNPTEEMLDILKEGSVIQLTRLQVSTTRPTDPFASLASCTTNVGQVLSLSGGRATTIRPLKAAEVIKFSKRGQPTTSTSVQDLIDRVYRPRSFLSVGSLKNIEATSFDRPRVVDFTALVIGTKNISASNSSRLHHTGEKSKLSVVYLASLRSEDGEEDFSTLAVLRIWGGLERYSLTSVLAARSRVRFTDVQMRDHGKLSVHSDFPPGDNSEVYYILLNYSAASYVTSEKLPRDPTIRRFQTPWKETPQFYSYMETCMESHFRKFFSGKSSSSLAIPNSLTSTHCSSPSTSILQQTPKPEPISVSTPCSLPNRLKGGCSHSSSPTKLETANKIAESPPMFPALKTRTRTGLCRPRRALPIATMTPTPTSFIGCNVSPSLGCFQLTSSRESVPSSCSPPERSLRPSHSTPLPVKRSCSLIENPETHSELLKTSTISSSPYRHPSAKRSRSSLFSSSSPKQETGLLPQLGSPQSPQFDFPISPPCLGSNFLDSDSLISVEVKVCDKSPSFQFHPEPSSPSQSDALNPPASVSRTNAGSAAHLAMTSEDLASFDVSIADLVKTRKRGRNSSSQNAAAAPKKRPLNLKGTP
ncbi:breast cancer type 2 susceptibility protein [Echinococcus multilocularis]|uniref:Breast cancer type 2 susceptibility protein n=1 Tax=Echinococcus multilocularis TaxID=6211 RepID=A0A068YBE0_ECHMU|nr:breast cancer type 2 susceptibility protein [Echinococcus multilocularis]